MSSAQSNGAASPLDFTSQMRQLCADVVARMPDFAHVDMSRVAVTFAQARVGRRHGLQAKLTPLRFRAGALVTQRNGRRWTVQRVFDGPREMLYILTFYLPRFLDQRFDEKLVTVFHELYHISPAFDGDIRRHDGRYHVHSHSQREYDAQMALLARQYLELGPPDELLGFLRCTFHQLVRRHGRIIGLKVPVPKLIPMTRDL